MNEPEDRNKTIVITMAAATEEELARALESLSRPIVGLVLDGITVVFGRFDGED